SAGRRAASGPAGNVRARAETYGPAGGSRRRPALRGARRSAARSSRVCSLPRVEQQRPPIVFDEPFDQYAPVALGRRRLRLPPRSRAGWRVLRLGRRRGLAHATRVFAAVTARLDARVLRELNDGDR